MSDFKIASNSWEEVCLNGVYLHAHTFYSCSSKDKGNIKKIWIFCMCNSILPMTQCTSVTIKHMLTSTKICLAGVHCSVYGSYSERHVTCQHLNLLASHFDNHSVAFWHVFLITDRFAAYFKGLSFSFYFEKLLFHFAPSQMEYGNNH